MRQANRAVNHPVGSRAGGHDAQLVRRAFVCGLLAAKGAGAVGDVTGQGVVGRCFVVAGIMAVVPEGCGQAVTQVRAVFQASMG
ncbi:hypothetical protein D3C79_1045710 [compost metagenome]